MGGTAERQCPEADRKVGRCLKRRKAVEAQQKGSARSDRLGLLALPPALGARHRRRDRKLGHSVAQCNLELRRDLLGELDPPDEDRKERRCLSREGQRKHRTKAVCLSREGSGNTGQRQCVLATKAVETQDKGSVS